MTRAHEYATGSTPRRASATWTAGPGEQLGARKMNAEADRLVKDALGALDSSGNHRREAAGTGRRSQ
jgi:hypothetical protein